LSCGAPEPFAEPRLAELASDEGGFHVNATFDILKHKPVGVRSNHDTKTAANVVDVTPTS
jgi:hypothetical protein